MKTIGPPSTLHTRGGSKEHGKFRQQDAHNGLDHNIDRLSATAIDFERLLEFSFTTKQNLWLNAQTSFFFEESWSTSTYFA
jgi:hypothetical protein